MAGKSKGLRSLLFGMGSLWAALGLCGCSITSHINIDNGHTPSKRSIPGTSARVSETFRKTYAAGKVKTLRVRAERGAIEIKPVEEGRDEIRIEATKTVQGSRLSEQDLKKMLSKVRITASLDGDALVIEAQHDKDGFPDSVCATVAFVISVPKRLALDLRTDNSPVSAVGEDGSVAVRSARRLPGSCRIAR